MLNKPEAGLEAELEANQKVITKETS